MTNLSLIYHKNAIIYHLGKIDRSNFWMLLFCKCSILFMNLPIIYRCFQIIYRFSNAYLVLKDVRTINEHIQNIYNGEELPPVATIREFRIVQISKLERAR